jgi:lysozyme family protein
MATQNLEPSLDFVFIEEGGYTDDPNDPGGATNLGITLRVLTAWRHTAVSKQDVRNLQRGEASAIYVANYWNVIRGPDLPGGIDLMLFDMGVNMGTARAARLLQTAVGVVADGAIGPGTLEATRGKDAAGIIGTLVDERTKFYESLPTFPHFGTGWLGRVQRARTRALALIQA